MAPKPGNSNEGMGFGLDDETRKAASEAFDALNAWRNDIVASTERYNARVFDKMAVAARKLGWPDNLIEATQTQMQQASKMQVAMIDHLGQAWKQQLNMPKGQMPQVPNFNVPGMDMQNPFSQMMGPGGMPTNPFQFWMQAAEMWQKSWQNAISSWSNGQHR
jgi:hypothetical protein